VNYIRLAMASAGAFIVYMVVGGLIFALIPSLKSAFAAYPGVYRSQEGQMRYMPLGMAAMLLSMVVLTVLYAGTYRDGSGAAEGAIFGALIALFAIGAFVVHNYVNLNIGLRITVLSAIAYFVEWTAVGIVIGLIYKSA
jgi:hypothetical protein